MTNIFPLSDRFLYTKMKEEIIFPDYLYEFQDNLIDSMIFYDGIGLAANQVGCIYRAFAIKLEEGPELVCFNPKIVKGTNKLFGEEGCLSYPDLRLEKLRDYEILVKYQSYTGKVNKRKFVGRDAICFQHELDHLNGINWKKE